MADSRTAFSTTIALLLTRTVIASPAFIAAMSATQAQAQAPQRLVSACSGVSLPPSVVTNILAPVVTGISGPTEDRINRILNLPLVGGLIPPLNLNATGLLNQAASGSPITLQALATDGTVIGPSDQCRVTSDAITLNAPAGVAIGGNQITGLGANGAAAFASDIDAVAMGNNARAEAGAVASIAFGQNSRVTAANSVALGAGSLATRGALAGYTALGLTGTQSSAGEVSIGSPTGLRQLTNVAAGTEATDAATVGQVSGVAAQVAALDAAAVRYDGVGRDRVTLAGAAGTTIGNVAPGTLAVGSTEAVNGAQLFATNQVVGANTSAIANVGAQVGINTASLVSLDTRVTSNTNLLAALDANAVRYDDASRTGITFGGAGGTVLDNVGPGQVASTSTQAVNGGQLYATNTQVAANTAAIAGLVASGGSSSPVQYSSAAAPTVPNGGIQSDDTTLVGASGGAVGLHNVRDAVVAAGSTDAVTGSQLFATNQGVANNAVAITNLDARVTNNEGQIASLNTSVSTNTTAIANLTTNVANNTTAITDLQGAVNSTNTNVSNLTTQVTANTTAITNLNNLVAGSTVSAVQYSNASTPTTPNGGTRTNDVTLVGADAAAPVVLHNVAGGAVAVSSTDAVNGAQLFATNQAVASNTAAVTGLDARVTTNEGQIATLNSNVANSLQYDRDASGARGNTVTLAGGNAAAPVTLANVAAGTVATGSAQAVNGGQLYATNQVAQQAAALGANSVQYDPGTSSVTLSSTTGAPVALRNVAAGTAPSDAVNVGQLQSSMQSAVTQANSYTDSRINSAVTAMNFDLGRVRREIGAGTSSALAAAGLPQPSEPGRTMVAIGGGTYRGQSAVAFGASTFLDDGHSILRLGATYDSRGYGGANAGFGYQF
jgi:hypothetical protein